MAQDIKYLGVEGTKTLIDSIKNSYASNSSILNLLEILEQVNNRIDEEHVSVPDPVYINEGYSYSGKELGDVVLYKDGRYEMITVSVGSSLQPYKDWKPVGIVVIPKSYNFYGDGTGAIMALKFPQYDSTAEYSWQKDFAIYPGGPLTRPDWMYDKCYTNMIPYTTTPGLHQRDGWFEMDENKISTSVSTLSSTYHNTYPREEVVIDITYADKRDSLYYFGSNDKFLPLLSLKHKEDFMVDCPQDDSGRKRINVLQDIDGMGNTAAYVAYKDDLRRLWHSGLTSVTSQYNAALASVKYSVYDDDQGEWYWPACGEIAYMFQYLKTIQNSLDEINEVFGEGACIPDAQDMYPMVSSTPASQNTNVGISREMGIYLGDYMGGGKFIPFKRY